MKMPETSDEVVSKFAPTLSRCLSARIICVLAGCLLTLSVASAGAPTYWSQSGGYQIELVRPGGDRPCTLFMLAGVNNSDPVMPGSRYFAISNTAPEYKTMVATLLGAKLAGRGVAVVTTGQIDINCGHPGVWILELPWSGICFGSLCCGWKSGAWM